MNKTCIILVGPPLGGKETLVKKGFSKVLLNSTHLPMGDRMREEVKKKDSHIGKAIAAYMTRGRLVPDELTSQFADSLIERVEDGSTLLSDGLPRTVGQIPKAFEIFHLHEMKKIVVLHIDTPEEECVRRAVESDGTRGHRVDDDLDVVRQRLLIYKNETIPVLHELRKNSSELGCDVITLCGMNMRDNAENFARGLSMLYNLKTK